MIMYSVNDKVIFYEIDSQIFSVSTRIINAYCCICIIKL